MQKIIDELFILQDKTYGDFQSKIVPNIPRDKIIGVRMPLLKKIAKEMLRNGEYKTFLQDLPHQYYEENTIHTIIISNLKDLDEVIQEIDQFLPYLDNWATSDALCPKVFAKDPNRVFEKVKEWIGTGKEYYMRFGVVTLLNFYLKDNFNSGINKLVASINSDKYYVNMAIAWYFSYALIFRYDQTISLFEKKKLSPWIQNKAIQKAIDSYRITVEKKDYLRSLKIK